MMVHRFISVAVVLIDLIFSKSSIFFFYILVYILIILFTTTIELKIHSANPSPRKKYNTLRLNQFQYRLRKHNFNFVSSMFLSNFFYKIQKCVLHTGTHNLVAQHIFIYFTEISSFKRWIEKEREQYKNFWPFH